MLPQLPLHGGDRNRTSPFAFTGNKFEFRALGSSMSLGFVNTVLNTIVAEAIDELAGASGEEAQDEQGRPRSPRSARSSRRSGRRNKRIVFDGDGYSEEWHAEAEERGLANLRTTPDALPWYVNKQTVAAFSKYDVLSERELESRYEVALEQYAIKLNIEAETAASIARTMILPAALRQAELYDEAEGLAGVDRLTEELSGLTGRARRRRSSRSRRPTWPRTSPTTSRSSGRSTCATRSSRRWTPSASAADELERIVADDLWPLPKYQEMLFIK